MITKPISAVYKNGSFIPDGKLDLPENSRVSLILVDMSTALSSPGSSKEQLNSEYCAAKDYFQFERENQCVPSDDELNYYLEIATHETR